MFCQSKSRRAVREMSLVELRIWRLRKVRLCIVMEMCYGFAVLDSALGCQNSRTMWIREFTHSSSCSFQMNDTLKRAISVRTWKGCFNNQNGKCWLLLSKIRPRAMQENRGVINHFMVQGIAHPKSWLLRKNSMFGNWATGLYQRKQRFFPSGRVKVARKGDLGNVIQLVARSPHLLLCWTVK